MKESGSRKGRMFQIIKSNDRSDCIAASTCLWDICTHDLWHDKDLLPFVDEKYENSKILPWVVLKMTWIPPLLKGNTPGMFWAASVSFKCGSNAHQIENNILKQTERQNIMKKNSPLHLISVHCCLVWSL